MPEYNVIIGNRAYKIELAKKETEGLFEARINSKPIEVKLEEAQTSATSPLTFKIGSKTYQAELEKIERRAPFELKINNAIFRAQLKEPPKKPAEQAPTIQIVSKVERRRGVPHREGTVVTPMAGKIVSVRVRKGDMVKVGDVVCILEAMKMENDITANKAGEIQEIHVSEGTAVNEGDILITIK